LAQGCPARDPRAQDTAGGIGDGLHAALQSQLDTPSATAAEPIADLERQTPWPERGRPRDTGGADNLARLLTDLASAVCAMSSTCSASRI